MEQDLKAQYDEVLVIGSRSYTGQRLCYYLRERSISVRPISSLEVDFRDSQAVSRFFSSLPKVRRAVIFLQVINKDVDNSYAAFLNNQSLVHNFCENLDPELASHVVYFSSVDVYGYRPITPITEDTPLNPDTLYGLAKHNSEWMLNHSSASSLGLTVVRVPGLYGNYPSDRSVVGNFARRILQGLPIQLAGEGHQLRDYLQLDDLCLIVERLLIDRYSGTLNLATGQSLSLLDIIRTAENVLQRQARIDYTAADEGRNFDLIFDISRLRRALPGLEFRTLADGLSGYR
jgi:UDP-glucose 4-epimerase